MSDLVKTALPSGQPVWIRIEGRLDDDTDDDSVKDVSFISAEKLTDFIDTVDSVVSSVQLACERLKPNEFSVEFGIAIDARSGKLVSALVEAGGAAHLKINAKWQSQDRDQ